MEGSNHGTALELPLTYCITRFCISFAALFVNVTHNISLGHAFFDLLYELVAL